VVNVVGSFLLGLLVARWGDDGRAVTLVGVGFCGSLTTFSSFAWESQRLAEDGAWVLSGANVLGSVVTCLAAAAVGWWLGA
jgi:CrcB protein